MNERMVVQMSLKISALVSGDSWILAFYHALPSNTNGGHTHICRFGGWNVCHVSYFINWYAHLFDINMLFVRKRMPAEKRHYSAVMITFVSDPFAYALTRPFVCEWVRVRYVLYNIIFVYFVLDHAIFFVVAVFFRLFLIFCLKRSRLVSSPSSHQIHFRFFLFFPRCALLFFMTNNGLYVCAPQLLT